MPRPSAAERTQNGGSAAGEEDQAEGGGDQGRHLDPVQALAEDDPAPTRGAISERR